MSRLRKKIKKVARKHLKVVSKAVKVVTPVLAAAGSIIGGPVLGTAIAGAGAGIARYSGAAAARSQGIRGRDARVKGRKLAKRTLIYGMGGAALGFGASLVAGGSALGGLAGAGALSSGAGKVMPKAPGAGGLESDWSSLAPDLEAGQSPVPDLANVQGGWDSLYNNPPSPGAPSVGTQGASGFGSLTQGVLGSVGALAGGYLADKGDKGSGSPGESTTDSPSWNPFGGGGMEEGGGGGPLSNPLVLAGIAVAAVLLLK